MEATMTLGANGTVTPTARERIAGELEQEIAGLLQRERALELELAKIKGERKSFEQAIHRLRGEPLIKQAKRGPYKKTTESRPGGTKLGQDTVARIHAAVLRYARDHDEFRQVDIRMMPDPPTTKSSVSATGFETLRQEGVIRLARKDGNNKWYRLTSEGIRQRDETTGINLRESVS